MRWASRWDGCCSAMMELPWVQASSALAPSPARGTPRWSQGTLLAYLSLGSLAAFFQRSCFDNPIAGVLGTSLQGIKIRCQVAVLHACILLLIVMELNFHQTSDWSLCYPRTEDECHVIDMQAALEKTGEAWFLCCKETKEAATHTPLSVLVRFKRHHFHPFSNFLLQWFGFGWTFETLAAEVGARSSVGFFPFHHGRNSMDPPCSEEKV